MRTEKKSNPYSSVGLEKFSRLNTELSAKREYVAKKKGVSGDDVRFVYRNQQWVPFLLKNNNTNGGQKAAEERNNNSNDGQRPAEDSIVALVESKAMVPVETKAMQERKIERNEYGELEFLHGAIGVLIVMLYMIYGGALCAILWACACFWWCVLAMVRKGEHGYFHHNKTRIRMTIDME